MKSLRLLAVGSVCVVVSVLAASFVFLPATLTSAAGSWQQIIPDQAVSGAFVETAEVYWAPGELAQPEVFIEAGSTYLVAGQDETGMYRKVLIACTWVWVRAETVGPNYDAVWNGTPLPSDVVEVGDSNACIFIEDEPEPTPTEIVIEQPA